MENWKKLDPLTACRLGICNAEGVIQAVCSGCADGNLELDDSKPYCPIQVDYGWNGEHESIQYDTETYDLRCDHWRESGDE